MSTANVYVKGGQAWQLTTKSATTPPDLGRGKKALSKAIREASRSGKVAPWIHLSTHPHVGTSYKERQSPSLGSPARSTGDDTVFKTLKLKNPPPSSLFRARWIPSSSQFCSASPPEVTLMVDFFFGGETLGGALLYETTHLTKRVFMPCTSTCRSHWTPLQH